MDQLFSAHVADVVASIPYGKVMTYGQIAAVCGSPKAARIVGGIAHYGDSVLPWHRVVNKHGGFASGYPGGRQAHAEHLKNEGISIIDQNTEKFTLGRVDLSKHLLDTPEFHSGTSHKT